jgi:hypothetical protein
LLKFCRSDQKASGTSVSSSHSQPGVSRVGGSLFGQSRTRRRRPHADSTSETRSSAGVRKWRIPPRTAHRLLRLNPAVASMLAVAGRVHSRNDRALRLSKTAAAEGDTGIRADPRR